MADPVGRVISNIHDAALDPRLWSSVLQSVAQTVGAIGAAYVVRNVRTGRVDWANFLGPSAKYTTDYITRFAAKFFANASSRRDIDASAQQFPARDFSERSGLQL